jgi:hypothetical protein
VRKEQIHVSFPRHWTEASLVLPSVCGRSFPHPAQAQISGDYAYDSTKFAYFIHGDTTVNGDIRGTSGNDVFVGKDNATTFATLNPATPINLSVTTGAIITGHGNASPDGNFYAGLHLFGKSKTNIAGGEVFKAIGHDTSTINLSGGSLNFAEVHDASTININGGTLNTFVDSFNTSTINLSSGGGNQFSGATSHDASTITITGGSIGSATARNTSTFDISGGTIHSVNSRDTSKVIMTNGSVDVAASLDTSTFTISGGTVTNVTQSHNSSTFTISGGNIAAANSLEASTPNITGGSVGLTLGYNTSILNLSGGSITSGILRAFDLNVTNLLGSGLSFASFGTGFDSYGQYSGYNLFGQLQDGQNINGYSLHDYSAGGDFSGGGNLLTFIGGGAPLPPGFAPEPGSILLLVPGLLALAVGGMAARRRSTA